MEARPKKDAMGFFTDSTLCIGCKACEVACKQWNGLPADGMEWTGQSYDNTRMLSSTTWRHVTFTEIARPKVDNPRSPTAAGYGADNEQAISWVFNSDVCKHCTECAVPDSVPNGGADTQRVRRRVCAAGRVQRLRLLRGGLPVRGARTQRG